HGDLRPPTPTLFPYTTLFRSPANVVLKEILPQVIAKLSFPKAMKWNSTGVRFARPVRWLVALYGGATLPIEAAGITAGNRTEGQDRKSTRLNSSHDQISYAVF